MPYVFTSWTAYTDPTGNSRTLDWSEAGMRGSPLAPYFEALRQAVIERLEALGPSGWDDPGELAPGHAFLKLAIKEDGMAGGGYIKLDEIDIYAWNLWPQTGASYSSGAAAWITADDDPMYQGSEEAFLVGGETRIALDHALHGAVNGAYLRQLRQCLMAKTRTMGPAPGYAITDWGSGWVFKSS